MLSLNFELWFHLSVFASVCRSECEQSNTALFYRVQKNCRYEESNNSCNDDVLLISLPVLFGVVVLIAGLLIVHFGRHKKWRHHDYIEQSCQSTDGKNGQEALFHRWWQFFKETKLGNAMILQL